VMAAARREPRLSVEIVARGRFGRLSQSQPKSERNAAHAKAARVNLATSMSRRLWLP
jgi:hypothetical protein